MISILFITLALLLLCVFYSLFLTSQFSIDSSFNKSKEFQGSLLFFALFNFQDAALFSLASLEDSLFIISHSFRFVKYFFQVFSNLFECSLPAFLSATFILYHISFVLSTPFSKFFQNFFSEMKYPLFFRYLLPSPTNAIPIGLLFQCSPSTALLL